MISISMMNNDCDLDSKSDSAGENRSRDSVSERGVVDYNEKPVDIGGGRFSCEIGVSSREEHDLGAPVDTRVSGNERSGEVGGMESYGGRGEVNKSMDSRDDSEVKDEETSSDHRFDYGDNQFDVKNDQFDEAEKPSGFQYKSLLSEFDDYVASEKNGMGVGMSRAISFGFEVGDMVWGKVKSHPWWPGHIFNEAFATASVRRTRREGLVLVAFFGDSSYGWFDPAELVSFDPNFAEKSQQTNSRTFVKAVEEAMDELSRRCGLGLACKCRNPFNFRPTEVQEYFAVDVPDFEPGSVYSEIQIRKARDAFHPGETLNFIKQLAFAPRCSDQKNIDFVKKKATVFAYRKAVFEEFDETYAQAFGVQGARTSRDMVGASHHPPKMPRLAPFSGPLVIAETLGSGKSSVKSPKVKDHSKKDRYLFKRREESSNSKVHQIRPAQANSSASLAYVEGSPLAVGDFVLQKRTPDISSKPEIQAKPNSGSINTDGACLSQDVSAKAKTMDHTPSHISTLATQDASLDGKPSLDLEKAPLKMDSDLVMGSSISQMAPGVKDGESQPLQQEGKAVIDLKHDGGVNVSVSYDGIHEPEPSLLTKVEGDHGEVQAHGGLSGGHSLPVDAKRVVGVKKAKAVKLPVGDSGSDISVLGEKKKKKKKRDLGSQESTDHPPKRLATGKGGPSAGKLHGKSTLIGLGRKEDPQLDHPRKNDSTSNSMSPSVWTSLMVGELVVPQLLTDLHALALIPFHGAERNSPAIIKEFFGKFRSDAFQKSQKSSLPSQAGEKGGFEARPSKPMAIEDVSYVLGEAAETSDLGPSKPVKALVRPNDPTKAGRKRGPSDRQEENAAKKVKRMNDLKSMAAEKKANQKTPEAQRVEGRKTSGLASAPPPKAARPDARRVEPPVKAADPTMLVMKFPPETSLPSVAELKARFARFGPLDHMAIRVFWKTSMCRVVFRHKRDAQSALKYASGNNSLFGNVNVRYSIREIGVEPAAEVPESGKGRRGGDDTPSEMVRMSKDPVIDQPPRAQQPAVQLKSILKKSSTGDEVTGSSNGGRGTPRVKFMLGGEETTPTTTAATTNSSSSNAEQLMVGNKNKYDNNASFAEGGGASSTTITTATTTSVVATMDFNSNNFQKVNPSLPPLSVFPPPPPLSHHQHQQQQHQFAKAPLPSYNNSHHQHQHRHHIELPRNNMSIENASSSIDISEQMISLLTRCNDVVSNVTGLLGYVPYHPL